MTETAFNTRFQFTRMFIRDRELTSKFEKKRNAALRRFGTILRRDARKSLKKGKNRDFQVAFLLTGNILHGAAANSALAARSAVRGRKRGGPPVVWTDDSHGDNLRSILFGTEESGLDMTVVTGPVGFGKGSPTVPEKLEHGDFPFMRPALDRKEDELLNSLIKFGVF